MTGAAILRSTFDAVVKPDTSWVPGLEGFFLVILFAFVCRYGAEASEGKEDGYGENLWKNYGK